MKQGQLARGLADATVAQMLREFIKKILAVMEGEEDTDQLQTLGHGMATCIKEATENCLTVEEVLGLVQSALKLMKESFDRREDAHKRRTAGDIDEDEDEEIDGELDSDTYVRQRLQEIVGAVMQTQRQAFLQSCIAPVQELMGRLLASKEEGDALLGVWIGCDFAEHLGEAGVPYWPIFMHALMDGLGHKDPDLRQACAYGLGRAAAAPSFAQHAVGAASRLAHALQDPKATKKKNRLATDNAAAALGMLASRHGAAIPQTEQYFSLWLQHLPLTHDEEEGLKVHRLLHQLVVANHTALLGASGEHLGRAFGVLAEVYKGDASDDELNEAIKQLCTQLGRARLEQLPLENKQKKRVLRLAKDAGI